LVNIVGHHNLKPRHPSSPGIIFFFQKNIIRWILFGQSWQRWCCKVGTVSAWNARQVDSLWIAA